VWPDFAVADLVVCQLSSDNAFLRLCGQVEDPSADAQKSELKMELTKPGGAWPEMD
jgi:hypothetical protein